jgi:hypothetical protein
MAGAGYKLFSTGDVLTASDLNTYGIEQTVMVFADSAARDTALTSAKSEGMFAFLLDPGDRLTYYDGSSWVVVDLAGDITGITTAAASGLSGGASSGTVTLTLNLAGLTAAQNFGSDGSGVDVTLHSDTAGDYALWDSSEEKLILEGTNGATVLDVTDGNVVIGDGTLVVGSDGAGEDVTFHSDTAGDSFLWDSSEEKLILEGTNAATVLDVTDGNVSIGDGTLAVSGAVTVGTDGAGADVTFHSATASDNFLWDASDEKLVITGTDGANALEVADGDVEITDKLTVTGQIVTHLLVSTESGTTHAPAIGDENAYILTTHGTGITVTLPQNSAEAFAIGTTIYYERNGAGTLTFAAGTGATITSKDSTLTCGDRYTTVAAVKIGTNAWSLIGNIG